MEHRLSAWQTVRARTSIWGLVAICLVVPGGMFLVFGLSLWDGFKWLQQRVRAVLRYGWDPRSTWARLREQALR